MFPTEPERKTGGTSGSAGYRARKCRSRKSGQIPDSDGTARTCFR
jgi:hypothetical protein